MRLREKQKLKRIYGVLERQFKLYFREAERLQGNTGENLMIAARAPAGQRRARQRLRALAQPRAPAHQPRPFPRERPARSTSPSTRSVRAT